MSDDLIPRVDHEEYARSMLHLARMVLAHIPEEKQNATPAKEPQQLHGPRCVCEACFGFTPAQRAAREAEAGP